MNKTTSTLLISSALLATSAVAGVPLNGLQGDGGIAFNPVAFVAGTYAEESQTISAPQVGTWYTRLDSADIDWAAASASFSIEKRLELSYGYGWTDANKYGDDSVSTHNLGLKLNVLPDGSFDAKWFPAVSAGAIYKHTDAATADALGLDKDENTVESVFGIIEDIFSRITGPSVHVCIVIEMGRKVLDYRRSAEKAVSLQRSYLTSFGLRTEVDNGDVVILRQAAHVKIRNPVVDNLGAAFYYAQS